MKIKNCCILFLIFACAAFGEAKATQSILFSDSFDVIGMNHSDINNNIERRQTGSLAPQNWTPITQGEVAAVNLNDEKNSLEISDGASARLNGLALSSEKVKGELTISFNIEDFSKNASLWTSFLLGRLDDLANDHNMMNGLIFGPRAQSGSFGFLYRANSGIQVFNNNNIIYTADVTSGGRNFSFIFTGANGSGSAFDGNGTQVTIKNGVNTIGSFQLDTGLTTNYIAFGSYTENRDESNSGYISNLKVTEKTTPVPPKASMTPERSGAVSLGDQSTNLIDVQFTTGTPQVGLAAIGLSSRDVWNQLAVGAYANPPSDGYNYKLTNSLGVESGVSLNVNWHEGVGAIQSGGVSDMPNLMTSWLFGDGNITCTLTGLGSYVGDSFTLVYYGAQAGGFGSVGIQILSGASGGNTSSTLTTMGSSQNISEGSGKSYVEFTGTLTDSTLQFKSGQDQQKVFFGFINGFQLEIIGKKHLPFSSLNNRRPSASGVAPAQSSTNQTGPNYFGVPIRQ